MPGTVAIFIDGGYMDKVLEHEHQRARIDYGALAEELSGTDQILRTYFYHCMPYRSKPPTEEEQVRYRSMHGFITVLRGPASFRGPTRSLGTS